MVRKSYLIAGNSTPFTMVVALLFLAASCSQRRETSSILLLATTDHFGLYAGEILRTEGFNGFITDSIVSEEIDVDYLKGFDIVVLAQHALTRQQAQALAQYVEEGGNLIAFRPDKTLQRVFGIKELEQGSSTKYISVVDTTTIGRGLSRKRLIIHASADNYELAGAREIAQLHTALSDSSPMPSVVLNRFGKGLALAFTYNLPESIVYTRQGNPANAGLEKDGILGIRAMDLFTHGFVDTTQNVLNPADEQMRLLTHAIEHMTLKTKPLPRFWYFPDSLKSVVTLNNDGEDSKEEEFLEQFQDVARHGASMTLYVKEPQLISPARVTAWQNEGFEISGHPDDTRQATHPDWKTMDSVYTVLGTRLKETYGIPAMKTITNHWFVWVGNRTNGEQDFAAQAQIEALHGVELDCNYAHYDNGSDQGHFLGPMGYHQGNYTGTGLTMKFAGSDGKIIDVYQQLNNVYDQQYMEHKDQDGYYNAFRGLMDRSIRQEVYSGISVRAHNNEYFFSKAPLMKIIDYAKSHHVPVWPEITWLEFLKAKDEATFKDIRWSDNKLTFSVHSARPFERDLSCIMPYDYRENSVSAIRQDGEPCKFDVVEIKGFTYTRIAVKPGRDHLIEVQYRAR